jgi:hypothetical protein
VRSFLFFLKPIFNLLLTKICNVDMQVTVDVVTKNVVDLEITMCDVTLVQVFHRLQQLTNDMGRILLSECVSLLNLTKNK